MGAKGENRLSEKDVRHWLAHMAKGTARTTKLSDGGGIFLALTPAGTPCWRFRYRFGGKEQLASLGVYPRVGRADARRARDTMKDQLTEGHDPVGKRRLERLRQESASGTTFADVAEQWFGKQTEDWCAAHEKRSRAYFENDVLPFIGRLPVAEIDVDMCLRIVKSKERGGASVAARKILRHMNDIYRYAQAKGYCSHNPAALVKELLKKERRATPRPALVEWDALGDIMRRADAAPVSKQVHMAHRLIAFTAVRIGAVILAEWSEFDLDGTSPKWTIPRAKCKVKDREGDFAVPLSPTIAGELGQWRKATGGAGYLFPSPTGKAHITHESLEKVYRKTLALDGIHSPHSWRSALSTLANDNGFDHDVVELALDHQPRKKIRASYDRGDRLAERTKLARWWDTELSGAQRGDPPANVIDINSRRTASR